jgi:hypothetical protein
MNHEVFTEFVSKSNIYSTVIAILITSQVLVVINSLFDNIIGPIINSLLKRNKESKLKDYIVTINDIDFEIGDGLQICASGKITSYEGRSNYQIIVDKIEIAGIGAILEMMDQITPSPFARNNSKIVLSFQSSLGLPASSFQFHKSKYISISCLVIEVFTERM